jgi:hypothetical protein
MSAMDNDVLALFAGIGLLVLYLIASALTEMGTKWPWDRK